MELEKEDTTNRVMMKFGGFDSLDGEGWRDKKLCLVQSMQSDTFSKAGLTDPP